MFTFPPRPRTGDLAITQWAHLVELRIKHFWALVKHAAVSGQMQTAVRLMKDNLALWMGAQRCIVEDLEEHVDPIVFTVPVASSDTLLEFFRMIVPLFVTVDRPIMAQVLQVIAQQPTGAARAEIHVSAFRIHVVWVGQQAQQSVPGWQNVTVDVLPRYETGVIDVISYHDTFDLGMVSDWAFPMYENDSGTWAGTRLQKRHMLTMMGHAYTLLMWLLHNASVPTGGAHTAP